jgi:hypothetical protein
MHCSRRDALQRLGACGVVAATAGCLGRSPGRLDEYALVATGLDVSAIGPPYLWPDPTAIGATTRVDFTDETKSEYVADLFETGRVTVQQWPLVRRRQWGTTTRTRPTFLRRDGSFYQVQVAEDRRLERERWHFAVERTDETPPEGARVVTAPYDLSPPDERVLEAALDAVYAGNDGFLGDPEFDEVQTVQYHRGLDAEASDLVPAPPFDFVEVGEQYFRPIADRRTVTVPEWTYTASEIADSREEFVEYASDAIVARELRADALSESARAVVDDAISEEPRRYEEGAPPSDGLTDVLAALGIAEALRPIDSYDERVSFADVVAAYRERTYEFTLVVTP